MSGATLLQLFTSKQYSEYVKQLSPDLDSPGAATTLCNRAAAYLHLRLFKHCLADTTAALQRDPTCLRAYSLAIQGHMGRNRKQDATTMFETALEKCPNGDILILSEMSRILEGRKEEPETPVAKAPVVVKATPAPETKIASTTTAAPVKKSMVKPVQTLQATQGEVSRLRLGAINVNTGRYDEAITIYQALIAANPGLVEARAGLGSAFAMLSRFDEAIECFAALVDIDDKNVDGWIRLAQTRAAHHQPEQAKLDLDHVMTMDDKNPMAYLQRGQVLRQLGDEPAALVDLEVAVKLDPGNFQAWLSKAICLNKLGLCTQAHSTFESALRLNPQSKECLANMAQAHKEYGNFSQAMDYFQRALDQDPKYANAYELRALACYGVGDMKRAVSNFTFALQNDSTLMSAYQMKGTALQSLGRYGEAVKCYDIVLSSNPKHISWFLREISLFCRRNLDRPLSAFSLDQMHPGFKDIYIKRTSPSLISPPYDRQPPSSVPDVQMEAPLTLDQLHLLTQAFCLEHLIQYRTPGFMLNKRQQRMFALAVVEMAQGCSAAFTGEVGVDGKSSSSSTRPHLFGWRDAMDIAIKWRQLSEPNDCVFWVDLLDRRSFQEGFGLQTPIINGHNRVSRYYPYYDRTYKLLQSLLCEESPPRAPLEKLAKANTLAEMWGLMGQDFYVTAPCNSCCGEAVMEGTRLTIQALPRPQGYVFSIRTPGTPDRFKQFEKEFSCVWMQLMEEMKTGEANRERTYEKCLSFYYYWVNFGALSRGTAACGLICLHGLLLCFNLHLPTPMPLGIQLDWEAILTAKCEDFVSRAKTIFPVSTLVPLELASFPSVAATVPTLRDLIRCCNFDLGPFS